MKTKLIMLVGLCSGAVSANENYVEIPSEWRQNANVIEAPSRAHGEQHSVGLYFGKRARPNQINNLMSAELSLDSKTLLFKDYKLPLFALASTEYSKLNSVLYGDTNHLLVSKLEVGTRPKFAQWGSGGVQLSAGVFWLANMFQGSIREEAAIDATAGLSMRLKVAQNVFRDIKIGTELVYDQQFQILGGLSLAI